MRTMFDWYLGAGAEETDRIWSSGILTLDANVLLDLYRYNTGTREDIIKAIGYFGDRVWISAQAAREFIRNRTSVIASSDKTFSDADSTIADLRKSSAAARDKLRGYRLVPREGLDEMSAQIDAAIDSAAEKINSARAAHPDYLHSDPLLDWIMTTFDGRVGEEPSAEEWQEIRKSGEARRQARIPPGYEDGDKDGDQKYGDYLLWRQIVEHARATQAPMILVTSERKEDWWERKSGKLIGPRTELMEEAANAAGQRILIYQTDRFLQHALTKIGTQVDASSVDDIREVDAERSRQAKMAAIRVTQIVANADESPFENVGTARVEVLRPIGNFTATVELSPNIDWSEADLTAELAARPADAPGARIVARVSSSGKLNLHGHTLGGGRFPPGVYEIAYSASALNAIVRSFEDHPPLDD